MASVTGITAEFAMEIYNSSIVDAQVTDAGQIEFVTRGGAIIDGGSIVNPYVRKAYPVGAIYMSVSNVNPATELGIGTWISWGSGRVPIGVDDGDPALSGPTTKTGGNKTHTLTVDQLPSHNHGGETGASTVDGNQSLTPGGAASSGPYTRGTGTTSGQTITGSSHKHTIASQGNGEAVNHMPPYITCYMWKRTA